MKRNTWLLILASVAVAMWILIPNLPGNTKKPNGAVLARKYCSTCHLFPDPDLLPSEVWVKGVLPEMGLRLGIGDKRELLARMSYRQFKNLDRLGIYPDTPKIPIQDWLSIVAYYREQAPKEPPPQTSHETPATGGFPFTPIVIPTDSGIVGQATMVRFIPDQKAVWVGSRTNTFLAYHLNGSLKESFRTPSPVVDVIDLAHPYLLGIGNLLPNEDKNGRLFTVDLLSRHMVPVRDSLKRPVQVLLTDLDKDNVPDLLIAEFGFETGQITLVNGRTKKESSVSTQPGARNIILRDVDQDGLPDLFVLFAQAKEQVSLFHNDGMGKFTEKVLLRFPPVWGSSFLEMADMNGDGLEDLILSFGDNVDHSLVRKNFHGVRIYLNNGKGAYTDSWFYPRHGATKTIARDFDGDGDLDLAMISFYGEKEDAPGFLFFENEGKMHFKPFAPDIPAQHWMVMDAGDMDGDGDQDLVLGNFEFGSDSLSKTGRNIQALILRNDRKH